MKKILFVILTSILFIACNKDEIAPKKIDYFNPKIVGHWISGGSFYIFTENKATLRIKKWDNDNSEWYFKTITVPYYFTDTLVINIQHTPHANVKYDLRFFNNNDTLMINKNIYLRK